MKAGQNSQVTNLGVAHKIDGRVIDITDTAMQRQVRKEVERKYADDRIVKEARAMLRFGVSPALTLQHLEKRVLETM